ncbi:DUF2249 domain-containing protein [Fodinibius sp.]|uniref:DUF2249 domain-containing protein n=1 Tax=Fodinibius sp. TaxID=1872440 RepID=UPI0035618DF3
MPDTIEKIDVRKIAPHKKHSTIFDTYDALEEGETFMIINDHDPKPLGYQMAAVHGEENFSWEYLEEGPDVWKVRIGKVEN